MFGIHKKILWLLVCLLSVPALAQEKADSVAADAANASFFSTYDSLAMTHFKRQQDFIAATIDDINADPSSPFLNFDMKSDAALQSLKLPDSLRLQAQARALQDYVGKALRDQQLGTGEILDFGKLARAIYNLFASDKKKKPKVAELPLPTPLEIDVLSMLWARGHSTSPQLFAQLDSTMMRRMTADMFWRILRRMAKRGFVREKIVSPQLAMMVGLGPFAVPVEMSPQNLRNRVYDYAPLINEEELFRYIAARNFIAREEKEHTAGTNGYVHATNELLLRMIKNRLKNTTE